MTRINFASTRNSIAHSKTAGALLFAALLIVCSIAVGCSSEKPQTVTVNQPPVTQNPAPLAMSTPSVPVAEPAKPAPKKVVHKRPPTVTYADKTYGVSFDYPRKYGIETGDAANELIATSPLPMNFVQPGGTALAAVELPQTSFPSTDFSSAFFNVSVHKNLSADECKEFAVTQAKPETNSEKATPSNEPGKQESTAKSDAHSAPSETKPSNETASNSKLMLGDMELRATEAVSGEGTRQSDSKYFHVYQNGACYEFALNVTTDASAEGLVKHVDRDKVFTRLEQILATVKINPVTPEVTAEAPSTAVPQTPAQ